jgi:zeaxanthin glucosyltransferase
MMHFGIISPPVSGHIHPFAALGRELISRGHRVTYLQLPDLERKVHSEGLEFYPIGRDDFPPGALPQWLGRLGQLRGLAAIRFTVGAVARTSRAVCVDAPRAIRNVAIDALLVDQMEPAGGAVAEHLGLPFITVCNALTINREPMVPPPFAPWAYRATWWAGIRNRIGYAVSDLATRPVSRVVEEFRAQWKLPALRSPEDSFSTLAQISQMPREFDFPRRALPEGFHYVGPLRRELPRPIAFPWDRLDGRPLVYASLGTLQNSRFPVFRCFAESCLGLNAQLVISHGGGLSDREAGSLPGSPVVVGYAPQLDLLSRASLTVTHAGLNTVLDSLTHGVPLVTVPITYEQPAIARRVERTGAGRSLPLSRLVPARLEGVIRDVLAQKHYREAARQLAGAIRGAGGVSRAADIIELAMVS